MQEMTWLFVAVKLSDISDDTMDQIKVAQIGNSDDLVVGEQVVAIGMHLGMDSLSRQVLSAP